MTEGLAAVDIERVVRAIPKIELHVHFGGAVTVETAVELARRHGGNPGTDLRLVDGAYAGRWDRFEGFLDAFLASNAFVRTPEDVELVARRFAEGQAAQGIAWSEVIFTAMIYIRNGMDPAAMWTALRRGLEAGGGGTARFGVVVDVIRDFGKAEADATIALLDGADAPIVGLCLTGIEGSVPTTEFVELGRQARRRGLGLEVHAGEMGPPSSVIEAIDVLAADRIGHGVASMKDPALVDRLVREQVVLDVCPSSNVGIGLFPSLEAHPVGAMIAAGMNVTVSSDDPPFFRTTLTRELIDVARGAGLGARGVLDLQRRAARAAFLPAAEREALVRRIDEAGADLGL
jgi:adenosine deaminase